MSPPDSAPSPAAAADPATADTQLLQRVIDEAGIDVEPEGPSVGGYVRELSHAFSEYLLERFDGFLPELGPWFGEDVSRIASAVLAALLAVLLAVLLGRAVARRRDRAREAEVPTPLETPIDAEELDRSPSAWRIQLAKHLEHGDVPAALQATWWWLATALLTTAADPAWTSREVALRAGRPDLLPLFQRLDRGLYGPAPPALATVRSLAAEVEEALA